MDPVRADQQANLDLVTRAGVLIRTGFADGHEQVFAEDAVFHFVNPQLPDLAGDHHGLDGIRSFFERLREKSDAGFRQQPHSLTAFGDELVVAYVTNTLGFGGAEIDIDALVVWRVFGGRIHEVWDIPAINTARPHRPDPVS